MIYRATALLASVTLVAAACSTATAAYEDVVIADGPVAFWQMDEPDEAGKRALDEAGQRTLLYLSAEFFLRRAVLPARSLRADCDGSSMVQRC